jgi:non-homologous end joining protein Ku
MNSSSRQTPTFGKKELQMAEALIDSMSDEWKPETC